MCSSAGHANGQAELCDFPREKFLETFEPRRHFDPAKVQEDLLVLMVKAYAAALERPLELHRAVGEKTPANRNHIPEILRRFPHAKILVTMRDPRAILAAQIALEKTRQTGRFSTYYVIAHWLVAAALAQRVRDREIPGFVVPYEQLVCEPARTMEKVCAYLEINFDPETVLTPTKAGRFWSGNSAARINFSQISQNRQRAGNGNYPKTKSGGWNGTAAISCRNLGTSQNQADASCDPSCVRYAVNAQGNMRSRGSTRSATQ